MLSPREATEAPRQWSRSPFSPKEVTESATVLVFLILSALLCSVNNADLKTATWLLYCLRLRSRSPHNAQHSTSYYAQCPRRGGSRRPGNEAIYIDVRTFERSPLLRIRCATRKRSRPDRESIQSS